jgi:hypothetical protein
MGVFLNCLIYNLHHVIHTNHTTHHHHMSCRRATPHKVVCNTLFGIDGLQLLQGGGLDPPDFIWSYIYRQHMGHNILQTTLKQAEALIPPHHAVPSRVSPPVEHVLIDLAIALPVAVRAKGVGLHLALELEYVLGYIELVWVGRSGPTVQGPPLV